MNKYEIHFNRRTSKIIVANGFYTQDGCVYFYSDENDILFVLSVYNFDYIEVL